MKSLFIDNTEETVLGVLNEGLEFDGYCHFEDKRNASRVHSRLNDLMHERGICPEDVGSVYVASGPGSYTGVRVVEGIAQIMRWQGRDIFSFYQFEVPFMSGVGRGVWVSPAWKGELFVCSWEGEDCSKRLVPTSDYKMTGGEYSFGNRCNGFAVQSVRELMMERAPVVLERVRKRGRYLPPYYYRKAGQEFVRG